MGRAPEARAKPERGLLRVLADPWGNVWINDEKVGRAPVRRSVRPGTYKVQIGDEYPEEPKYVKVAPGEQQEDHPSKGGDRVTERAKYEIGRKLGQGGMAETFEATRTHANGHGFRVALKQVLPELLGSSKDKEKEFLQRFSQEAQIGATLEHPNIVRVVDTGMLGGRPYLAMELVDGVSLAQLLNVLPAAGSGCCRRSS